MRWEWQEVTEKRWVPQNVTENREVTQVQYVPVVSYASEQQIQNRWNPFATAQAVNQYVPQVQYQPVNKVVNTPVTYQKYVEQDVTVRVPKLVEATESRTRLVDRPRSNQANLAAGAAVPTGTGGPTAYATTPIYAPAPINYAPTAAPQAYNTANYGVGGSIAVPSQTFPLTPQQPGTLASMPQAFSQPVVLAAPTAQAPPGLQPTYQYNPTLPNSSVASNQPLMNFGQPNQFSLSQLNPFKGWSTAPAAASTPLYPQNNLYNANAAQVNAQAQAFNPDDLVQLNTTPSAVNPALVGNIPNANPNGAVLPFNWGSWIQANGPLFKSSFMRQNSGVSGVSTVAAQSAVLPYSSSSSLGFGGPSAVPYQYNNFAPQQFTAPPTSSVSPDMYSSQVTLGPSSGPSVPSSIAAAPVYPAPNIATTRSSQQSGSTATQLR